MTLGQAIGGTVGAVGGFVLGGFTPAGAIVGFQIGLAVGGMIDPPKSDEAAQGFQSQDLQFNTFSRNLPVPVVYGSNRIAGNSLWIGNTYTEVVEREASGVGKGAPDPPKTREVWYHADFAMALSEGKIVGPTKVSVDDEDVTDKEGLSFTTYVGDATQVANAKVVQALGADAPAFRNTAYLLFSGRLGQMNRIPNVTAIIDGITEDDAAAWTLVVDTGITMADNTSLSFRDSAGRIYAVEGTQNGPDEGGVFRSDDGGATWAKVGKVGHPIYQLSEQGTALYAASWKSPRIYKSTDQGVTWTLWKDFFADHGVGSSSTDKDMITVTWRDANVAAALIGNGTPAGLEVWVTENGGTTWAKKTIPAPHDARAEGTLIFLGTRLILGGENGEILTSDNLGAAWTSRLAGVEMDHPQWIVGRVITTDTVVLWNNNVHANSSMMAISRDGGITWTKVNGPAAWGGSLPTAMEGLAVQGALRGYGGGRARSTARPWTAGPPGRPWRTRPSSAAAGRSSWVLCS